MEHTENHILIRGSLSSVPVLSHENHGRKFYRFFLEVPRLSGTLDRVPVVAADTVLSQQALTPGTGIRAEGQIRTHNLRDEEGRHLQVFLFAASLSREDGPPLNQVEVTGSLCRDPVLRQTPLGREICDLMLAVPRAYHRADYLPCILWGRTAQEADQLRTGDRIHICGRLQSREYRKLTDRGEQIRTAYEISAMTAGSPQRDE